MTARRQAAKATPQRGMTLIEVIVALLIFSFGLLGLVGLQGRAHTFAMSAEDSNRAALLANEIVTNVVLAANLTATGTITGTANGGATGTATLTTPSAAAWTASAAAAKLPNASVVFGTLQAGGKRLPITISWKSPTAPAAAASSQYQTEAIVP